MNPFSGRTRSIVLVVGLLWSGDSLASDPVLVAHRGLLRHAPENTLPAFAACLELGMGFELDIRTTADGKLVVFHDQTLGRTTNGPDVALSEYSWEQLRKLDAGSWFDPRYAGVRVPSLEETFALIRERRRGTAIIALNVKQVDEAGERRLIELLHEFDLFAESFAFDQSEECSRRLKQLDPRIRIGSNVARADLEEHLVEDFIDVFLLTSVPTRREVDRLRGNAKQVLYNYAGEGAQRREADNWLRARDAGIDGMLTDYPLACAELWRNTTELEVVASSHTTVAEHEGITGAGRLIMANGSTGFAVFPNHPDDFGDSLGTSSAVSIDGGETWQPGPDGWPIPDTVALWIDRLGNGDLLAFGIHWVPDPATRRDPTPPRVPADAYEIAVSKDHGETWESTIATIDCPLEVGFIARPLPHISELKDGTLLMPAYTWSRKGNSAVVLESADGGRHWRFRSVITTAGAMIQAGARVTTPWLESSIAETGDGSLLAIVRSGSSAESHLVSVHSDDQGKTWSTPEVLPFPGKLPTLIRLPSGPLALVTALTKHHCRLYLSGDGSGHSWSEAYVINSMAGSNVGVTPIGGNQLMIATPARGRIDACKITIASPAETALSLEPPSEIRFAKNILSWKGSPGAVAYRVQPILIEPGAVFSETPALPYAMIETPGAIPRINLQRTLLQGGVYAFAIAAVDKDGRVSQETRSQVFRP